MAIIASKEQYQEEEFVCGEINQNHAINLMIKYVDFSCGGIINEMLNSPKVSYNEFESLIMKINDHVDFDMVLKLQLSEEDNKKNKLMQFISLSLIDEMLEKVKNTDEPIHDNNDNDDYSSKYPMKGMSKSSSKTYKPSEKNGKIDKYEKKPAMCIIKNTYEREKKKNPNKKIIIYMEKLFWNCVSNGNKFIGKLLFAKLKEMGNVIKITNLIPNDDKKIIGLIENSNVNALSLLYDMEPMTDFYICDIFRVYVGYILDNGHHVDSDQINKMFDWLDQRMNCKKEGLILSFFHEMCCYAANRHVRTYYERYKQYINVFSPLVFHCKHNENPNVFLVDVLFDSIYANNEMIDKLVDNVVDSIVEEVEDKIEEIVDDIDEIDDIDDDIDEIVDDIEGSGVEIESVVGTDSVNDNDPDSEVNSDVENNIGTDSDIDETKNKKNVTCEVESKIKESEEKIINLIQNLCMDILCMDYTSQRNHYDDKKKRASHAERECECGSARYVLMIMTKFFALKLPYNSYLMRSLFYKIKHENCRLCRKNKTGIRIEFAKLVYKWCPGLVDHDVIDQCKLIMKNIKYDHNDCINDNVDYLKWALSCIRLSASIIQDIIYENTESEMIELCQLCMKHTTHHFKECDHPICKKCVVLYIDTIMKNHRCSVCNAYARKNKDKKPPIKMGRTKYVSSSEDEARNIYASSSEDSDFKNHCIDRN